MKRLVQRSLCCPCGNDKVLALGVCATCYTLRRQDEAYFGGHREEVLERDGYRCRVPECTTLKRGKRSVAVHHRKPGIDDPKWMITLCLACHAKVTRTLFLRRWWPKLLICCGENNIPRRTSRRRLSFEPISHSPFRCPCFQKKTDLKAYASAQWQRWKTAAFK